MTEREEFQRLCEEFERQVRGTRPEVLEQMLETYIDVGEHHTAKLRDVIAQKNIRMSRDATLPKETRKLALILAKHFLSPQEVIVVETPPRFPSAEEMEEEQ